MKYQRPRYTYVEMAYYTTREAQNDPNHGTFFYPKCCGKRLYSVKDKWAYDGVLCPNCNSKYKKVILRLADEERMENKE